MMMPIQKLVNWVSTTKLRRFLVASEIAGGILLLVTSAFVFFKPQGISVWYSIGSLALGSYAVIAGLLLWKNRPLGRPLSIVLQAIQVVQIANPTLLLKIIVGVHLSLFFWQRGGMKISPGVAGNFGIWDAGYTELPGLGINLVALAAVLLLAVQMQMVTRSRA
jgi:hypothetical protein